MSDVGIAAPPGRKWLLSAHPAGFWFVFWAEFAERASFYGMRVLLALYLVEVFGFQQADSGSIVQLFTAACYLTPILGGFIADHFLGRYRTIVWFCIPYILGHLILGYFRTEFFLFLALALLALGSGTIKPNTSTLMGMMYERLGKGHLLDDAFAYYYAAINLGSTVASLSLPLVQVHYGYEVALFIPAALIAVSMIVFVMGRHHFPKEALHWRREHKTPERKREERAVLARLIGILAMVAVYWYVADQSGTTWVFLAKSHMNLELWPFGISLTAAQTQGLNPLIIILFTPILAIIWRKVDVARGKPLIPTDKMIIGFVLTVAALIIMSMAGGLAGTGRVSVWFLVLATFLITLGELCISVVGLQLCYVVAPQSMKSQVTALFLLTSFVGDTFGAAFDQLYGVVGNGVYFGIQALLALGALLGMVFVARSLQRRELREVSAAAK
ncbi:peptide MFS transporter [Azorhizobium sp. AG788]|uniref:peptide MFS transporter n=1 Tax=Azorhizobium sp. AG788 TaxID=2183897 RepID=UPI0031398BA3